MKGVGIGGRKVAQGKRGGGEEIGVGWAGDEKCVIHLLIICMA